MIELILVYTNFIVLVVLGLYCWLNRFQLVNDFPDTYQKGVIISQGLQLTFLTCRCFLSGHFPLSNLYESLILLSWLLTLCLMFLNRFIIRLPQQQLNFQANTILRFIGAITIPAILLINGFILFSLPDELKQITALVPALQSNWLVMHVTVMILSYASLIIGCLFSMAFLVFDQLYLTPSSTFNWIATELDPTKSTKTTIQDPFSIASFLDTFSYRLLGLGFIFLTIGLLSGSIWANQTWGSYWSWDPKETWALITWFIFATYLHTRLSQGWHGRNSAQLATFGFFILWICYLGVNLMGKGLHSYGFLN